MMPWRILQRVGVVALVSSVMAACGSLVPSPAKDKAQAPQICEPAAVDDALIGNWLNKRTEKGVAGELRTLFTLRADGRMLYTEQLKRPRQPSQGLSESGCWWRSNDQLVLKTLESNGSPVDDSDPIYTNAYRILQHSADKLTLSSQEGVHYETERTSPGYRLPF